jgi:hypothetical protein
MGLSKLGCLGYYSKNSDLMFLKLGPESVFLKYFPDDSSKLQV